MSESGSDPEIRRPPPRPEFVVEPLRPRVEPTGPTVAFRVALCAWVAVAVVVLGLAAVVAFEYDGVRAALETSVQDAGSGATSSEVSDTVTVTLLGSGAVALLLLVFAGLGLSMAAARKVASGILLLVVGLATIGASMLFWSFMSDAGSIAAGVLQWGPLACAGFAGIATVAAGTGLTQR
ncbi:hypothetical protein [Rhodococcoides kyotonense]|uniref:Tryptophan-associated transmembrane protein (Trp_oprn_chp) n=1 Tax=Rhodococcoides kyotonense TaxID=398843 RepID=A0A239LNR1_9NOCA|nr:hypothetical protein [Rhodococcus kyotonensis]SNT31528.1 hypothetical protein SAMN05421642_113160 [Rhodococcus kyotonensis]